MPFPDLGSRARVSLSGEVGVIIAPVPHTAWINYHEPSRKRIHVFALMFESGEVRFFSSDAIEAD